MKSRVLGCLAAMATAIVVATPAVAFRGGGFGGGGFHGGFGGGGFHGGFGGGGFHGGFGGGGFSGGHFGGHVMGMGGFNRGFAGRSMAMGGFNRGFGFNHGMLTGRSVAMNRGSGFNRGFDHRFAHFDHFDHFHHFHHFHDRFFHDRFAFFPVFVGGGWGWGNPYGDGCWRWNGWQWINICYNYGGYNYSY